MKRLSIAILLIPFLFISNSANAAFIQCTYGSNGIMTQTPLVHFKQSAFERTLGVYYAKADGYTNPNGPFLVLAPGIIHVGAPWDFGLTHTSSIVSTSAGAWSGLPSLY